MWLGLNWNHLLLPQSKEVNASVDGKKEDRDRRVKAESGISRMAGAVERVWRLKNERKQSLTG